MRQNAPYFSILLCLTPDEFTRQGESRLAYYITGYNFKQDLGQVFGRLIKMDLMLISSKFFRQTNLRSESFVFPLTI
jgi:hypothetical protein